MAKALDSSSIAASDRMFRLADGRRLAYREFGAAGGHPVLALHGTPGSRLMFAMADGAAGELGLRLIAPDRWGYGRTDAHPRPSLPAWAEDIRELADGLGLQRFSSVGISGGGPFAAAAAAALGRRIDALALAVPVGPIAAGDAVGQLAPLHRVLFRGGGAMPAAVRAVFAAYRAYLQRWPDRAVSLVALRGPKVDRDLVRSKAIRDHLAATFRAGFAAGVQGPVIDMQIFARAWQVPLDLITARTHVWVGSRDRLVPVSAALGLSERIPRAVLTELPAEGHFWIARDYAQVLRWIAGQ